MQKNIQKINNLQQNNSASKNSATLKDFILNTDSRYRNCFTLTQVSQMPTKYCSV